MVATDVASRGIGMIDHRSALPLSLPLLTSCGSSGEAVLSVDVCSAAATIWSRLMTSFGSLAKSSWISLAVWLATFSFRSYVPSGYRGGWDSS
jgi:hypothetical protein